MRWMILLNRGSGKFKKKKNTFTKVGKKHNIQIMNNKRGQNVPAIGLTVNVQTESKHVQALMFTSGKYSFPWPMVDSFLEFRL